MQERARISREVAVPDGSLGRIDDLTVLRYSRTRTRSYPRVAIGLYTDLELHVEVPYVLGDDTTWRYGFRGGRPVNDATPGAPGGTPSTRWAATARAPARSSPCRPRRRSSTAARPAT